MKRIVVRKIWLWVLLAAVLSLNGCVNFNDLKITSFKVDKVLPQGFKSVLWSACVGVDNPSVEFSLYDISGTIKRGSAPLGRTGDGERQDRRNIFRERLSVVEQFRLCR